MKKLLTLFTLTGLISTQVMSADLIFKNSFENNALVSGNVTNLNSNGLSLKLSFTSSQQILTIANSGSFVFNLEVPVGENWSVSIQTQPSNPCTLSNASGTMSASGFGNVLVSCSDTVPVNIWDVMKWDEGSWQ